MRELVCQSEIESKVQAIHQVTAQILEHAEAAGFSEEAVKDLRVALDEALANAVIHGNANMPARRIKVRCFLHRDGTLEIRIRDQGQGFDRSKLPDPTDPANLLRPHGRGIFLIKCHTDGMAYNRKGNEIKMWKKKH